MFNFLNSAILIAAAAALIPLLIHLFSRRRVKIVDFSSLKHLKEMQKRQVRRIKIRQLLLLILRMLIILAVVLAFARPATKGGFIGSHAGVSSVILLDKSASMQRQVKDGRLFDLAKKSAENILQNFGQNDEVLLLPYDSKVYFPAGELFFSRETAERVLDETEAGYDADNFQEAYNSAIKLLAEAKNLNKELYIINDRQLKSLPEKVDSAGENISCYLVELPTEIDGNCGLIDMDMGGQLIEVGADFNIEAVIQNYDNFDKEQLMASMFIDDVRVMQSEYSIEAHARQSVRFKHTVSRTGFHQGWIEISDDAYPVDNRYYFSFRIPEQFNILVVDGDGGGELIKLALTPSDKLARYWSVKSITPDKLADVKFRDYDVIAISGVPKIGEVESSRLFRYVDDGGGLFFIADAAADIDYFNKNFGRRTGLTMLANIPDFFSGAGYYTLERFDYSHPIFKAFELFKNDSLPTLKYFVLPKMDKGNSRGLAYYSNGDPAIIEIGYGRGKIILNTAPIAPKYSDLSSHSFFVPFIIRTMEYLADDLSRYESDYIVGQNINRTISNGRADYTLLTLKTPDNREYEIAGIEKPGGVSFECLPINQPGIYLLNNKSRTIDLFPVNVPTAESDMSAVDADRLKSVLAVEKFKAVPYAESFAAAIGEARFGRELWKIFLWLAAMLLLVEMLFSREGGGSGKFEQS